MKKKLFTAIALTAALTLGGGAVSPAVAAPIAAAKKVSGVYQWWNPICWNIGYGVPGGRNGWCYDG